MVKESDAKTISAEDVAKCQAKSKEKEKNAMLKLVKNQKKNVVLKKYKPFFIKMPLNNFRGIFLF